MLYYVSYTTDENDPYAENMNIIGRLESEVVNVVPSILTTHYLDGYAGCSESLPQFRLKTKKLEPTGNY